jgi:diguanylate cyclase (GGDEF)-like protein
MDPTTLSFRDDLEAKLADIEGVLRSTHLEPGKRDGAVRRLAKLLGASGTAHGLREVSDAADIAERAPAASLPQAAEKLLVILRRVVEDPSLRRATILLIAPDGGRRNDLKTCLTGGDREILVATAQEAERLLREKHISVVIVDAGRSGPYAEGLRLLHLMRSRPRFQLLPVIALCDPEDQELCYGRGADACLPAPQPVEAVIAAIEASLRRMNALARAVRKDALTGLLNRAGLIELYARQSASAARNGAGLCIAVLEIDDLAAIEQHHGPIVADEAMRHLAGVLSSVLRRDDVIAAWDQERLVALFHGAVPGAARAMSKALRASKARPLEVKGVSALVDVTFSAGLAQATPGAALDEVVAEADRRLWLAEAAGLRGVHADEVEPLVRARIIVALHDTAKTMEVSHRLRHEGFDITCEEDGQAVLKALRTSGEVALCVLSARLPGRDGFSVLERLRRGPLASRVPVIMITSGREAEAAEAFKLGADDQLATPFSITELIARVRRLLRRRAGPLSAVEDGGTGAIVGKFVGDQLVEFVQMLGVTGKTGAVRVSCDTFSGSLYIERGKIVGASTSLGSSALEAAYEALLTPHGRFIFEPGLPPGVRRDLSIPVDAFLLEAVRRRDELRRRSGQEV